MARAGRRRKKRSLTARLASTAFRRGLTTGARGWWYAGVATTGLRLAGRLLRGREDVHTFRLRPGEGLEIRELPRER